MAYIPFLAGQHLHAAHMAHAIVSQEDICPHLGCDANALDQWTGSLSSLP